MISRAHAVLHTAEGLIDAAETSRIRTHIEIQNLDATNFVVITFGGEAATLTNGIKIAAGETWKLTDTQQKMALQGEIRAIASTATVNITYMEVLARA